jgi:ribonuclease HI
MPQRSEIHYVYADGSCLGNPGPGGWAAVIVKPSGVSRTIYGGDPATTNNRMELTGAIEGLRMIPTGTRVVLRSDSQYVVKTMNLKWKRKQNIDLWEKLDAEIDQRHVKFEWVEGHAGDPLNEEADRHARAAAATAAKTGRVHYHGLSIVEEQPPSANAPVPSSQARKAATVRPSRQLTSDDGSQAAYAEVVAHELSPLLRATETILECAECGHQFVGNRRTSGPNHCSLVECQLKARRTASRQSSLFKN